MPNCLTLFNCCIAVASLRSLKFLLDAALRRADIETRFLPIDSQLANLGENEVWGIDPTHRLTANGDIDMDKTDLEYDIAIVLMVLASLAIAFWAQLAFAG